MSFWAVVQTHPQSERKAEVNLRRQGFDCYLPRLKKNNRIEWMFPRYLFLLVENQWRSVLGTFGVSKILQDGDKPAKLPVNFVDELKSRTGSNGYIELPNERFRRGERIGITGGIFAGQYGTYLGGSSKDREYVLLDVLGRVELATSDLL